MEYIVLSGPAQVGKTTMLNWARSSGYSVADPSEPSKILYVMHQQGLIGLGSEYLTNRDIKIKSNLLETYEKIKSQVEPEKFRLELIGFAESIRRVLGSDVFIRAALGGVTSNQSCLTSCINIEEFREFYSLIDPVYDNIIFYQLNAEGFDYIKGDSRKYVSKTDVENLDTFKGIVQYVEVFYQRNDSIKVIQSILNGVPI